MTDQTQVFPTGAAFQHLTYKPTLKMFAVDDGVSPMQSGWVLPSDIPGSGSGGATIPAAGGQLLGGSGTAGTAVGVTLGAGLTLSSGTLTITGVPLGTLAQGGATNGQLLGWTGSGWGPVTPAAGTTYSGTAPVVVSGGVISLTLGTGANTVAAGNDSRIVNAVQQSSATGAAQLPVGSTAQRPDTGALGEVRYNTTTGRFEFGIGGSWINHARFTDLFGATTAGLVPASGTPTGKFLRDDGAFANAGNSLTETPYTGSGAIAITDDTAVLDSTSALAMTLGSGTVTKRIFVKKKNASGGAHTLTANIDGAANTVINFNSPNGGDAVLLEWSVALSTWKKLDFFDNGLSESDLPAGSALAGSELFAGRLGTSDFKYTSTQIVALAFTLGGVFTQRVASTPVALTDGATISVNAQLGNIFTVTLGGNRTLANPTSLVAGQELTFIVTQDGTGSRTLTFGTLFTWPSGAVPTLSTAAGAVDLISCIYDGTKLRGGIGKAYA